MTPYERIDLLEQRVRHLELMFARMAELQAAVADVLPGERPLTPEPGTLHVKKRG